MHLIKIDAKGLHVSVRVSGPNLDRNDIGLFSHEFSPRDERPTIQDRDRAEVNSVEAQHTLALTHIAGVVRLMVVYIDFARSAI